MGYCNGLNFTISQASMDNKCEQFGRLNQDKLVLEESWKPWQCPSEGEYLKPGAAPKVSWSCLGMFRVYRGFEYQVKLRGDYFIDHYI